jgi:hypothetical protein
LVSASQTHDTFRKTSVSPGCFRFLSIAPEEHAPCVSPSQRTTLFREVNDRIYELLESGEPDLPGEFLCECGSECNHRVQLLPAAFAKLRQTGRIVRSPQCSAAGIELRGVPALS